METFSAIALFKLVVYFHSCISFVHVIVLFKVSIFSLKRLAYVEILVLDLVCAKLTLFISGMQEIIPNKHNISC